MAILGVKITAACEHPTHIKLATEFPMQFTKTFSKCLLPHFEAMQVVLFVAKLGEVDEHVLTEVERQQNEEFLSAARFPL